MPKESKSIDIKRAFHLVDAFKTGSSMFYESLVCKSKASHVEDMDLWHGVFIVENITVFIFRLAFGMFQVYYQSNRSLNSTRT